MKTISLLSSINVIWFGVTCMMGVSSARYSSASRKSKQFMKKHSCIPEEQQHNSKGFASYKVIKMSCEKLTPSVFWHVTCGQRCKDPVSGQPLPRSCYKVEQMMHHVKFNSVYDGRISKALAFSCRCVELTRVKRKCLDLHKRHRLGLYR